MSVIKINRALRLATIGSCPGSALDMLDHVPAEVRAALTSTQLASLIDAMWRLAQASKALANREAVQEGAVWDAAAQRLREIAA